MAEYVDHESSLHAPVPLDGVGMVILDFDGVVADSEVISLSTLRDALAAYGLSLSLADVRQNFLGSSISTISEFVRSNGTPGAAAGFEEQWQSSLFAAFRKNLEPIPGIEALVDRLTKQSIPYCIASSSSFERLDVALEAIELKSSFPRVFSAEQVRKGKPAPDLFLFAAEQCQIDPAHCLVIEDSPHGVGAARAAGMSVIGFVGGRHLHDIQSEHASKLLEKGAEQVLKSLDDVCSQPNLLRRSG